jgi:hypothetical protein
MGDGHGARGVAVQADVHQGENSFFTSEYKQCKANASSVDENCVLGWP